MIDNVSSPNRRFAFIEKEFAAAEKAPIFVFYFMTNQVLNLIS